MQQDKLDSIENNFISLESEQIRKVDERERSRSREFIKFEVLIVHPTSLIDHSCKTSRDY